MPPVLILLLVIALPVQRAAGADAVPQRYDCEPVRPVFCRNIHLGCAGKTDIPTSPFRVSITDGLARLHFEGPEPPLQGRVSGSGDLIIRPDDSRSWIRIQRDGRYSHRIYPDREAAMSQGICRSAPSR